MSQLEKVHAEVASKLKELEVFFLSHCQLSFIMRVPGNDDGDMLVSNDNLDELGKLIERCKDRLKESNQWTH